MARSQVLKPNLGTSSQLQEVRNLVKIFNSSSTVVLAGVSLTVAEVAAIARRSDVAVTLDAQSTKHKVDKCAQWVLQNTKHNDIYAITTGFGAHSNRRVTCYAELQKELIRYLNAGIVGRNGNNVMPVHATRATMLVRINCLLQGYSGIRWEILEAMVKLMNSKITPIVPLRGSITASGDLMPLAYIAGVLLGRPDSTALTPDLKTVSSEEALEMAGVEARFDLQPKEGIALVNGTSAGSGLGAIVCFDANILVVFAEVLSAMFCEVIYGRIEFVDPLIHQLKHHPGQMEAASIMSHILRGSLFMEKAASLNEIDHLRKLKQDRYALRSSPQWLGPQIEVIRHATQLIEREINSVNDNPLIDVDGERALHCGNFQGTPIGTAMDNIRIALAAIGKLIFAQFSELVNASFNNGLPSNLSAAADPALDYGFHCAEIAMASYISELEYLANPVTTHVQTAEHHNQAVNSLGLISARKSEEAVEILKIMLSTYLLAISQAIDLRHLEAALHEAVKSAVSTVALNFFPKTCVEDMLQELEKLYVYSYIHDPLDNSSIMMNKLRSVILSKARCCTTKLKEFEIELKPKLESMVATTRRKIIQEENFTGSLIEKSVSYPLYRFVRELLDTKLIIGGGTLDAKAPKQDLEKIFDALTDGKLVKPLLECLEGLETVDH